MRRSPPPHSSGADVPSAAARIADLVTDVGGNAGLFLDFDGTVSLIVDDPERAIPVPGTLEMLDRLAAHLAVVAVVSGRPAEFLLDRLGFAQRHPGLRGFGLYGGEEIASDRAIHRPAISESARAAMTSVASVARLAAPGARIEEKGEGIALHFRERPEDEDVLREVARAANVRFGLEVREGRKVVELVAPHSSDKGGVVRRAAIGLRAACAIGDDVGDLAAFGALDELRASGCATVKVAVGGSEAPVALIERADIVLASPTEVVAVLTDVADTLDRRAGNAH